MSLFNFRVSAKEPFEMELGNAAFWMKNAVLTKGGSAVLRVAVQNEVSASRKTIQNEFCLSVLRKENPNAPQDLKFDSEKIRFTVEGDGVVDVLGNRQSFDPVSSSEENESPQSVEPAAKKRKVATVEEPKKVAEAKSSDDLAARKKVIEEKRKQQIEAAKASVEQEAARIASEKAKAKQAAEAERKKMEEEKQKAAEAKAKVEQKKKEIEERKKAEEAKKNSGLPIKKVLEGGLKIEISKQGSGASAKPGRKVKVAYDGRLASNGKRFDKGSIDFKLGMGEVIKGWDMGVKGMMVGEKRKLFVPPSLGYGARGAPPSIPRNAALIFDVELLRA